MIVSVDVEWAIANWRQFDLLTVFKTVPMLLEDLKILISTLRYRIENKCEKQHDLLQLAIKSFAISLKLSRLSSLCLFSLVHAL